MAEDRIRENKVGTPPPGGEQSAGQAPMGPAGSDDPARVLARDPHIHDDDPTNQRVDRVRRSLEDDDSPETRRSAARADREPLDSGSPAPTPLSGLPERQEKPGAATPVRGQETAQVVSQRPFSLQAEEGQHHAAASERAPYGLAPPADTLGTRHVEEALSDLIFPMTREELLARAGNWRIPVTGRSFRTLSEYLQGVDQDRFRSAHDVAHEIERASSRRHPADR